jgi:hypothetical protein
MIRLAVVSVLLSTFLFGEGIFRSENTDPFYMKNRIFVGWLEKSYSYDEIRAYGKYIEATYSEERETFLEYADYLAFRDFEERVLNKLEAQE